MLSDCTRAAFDISPDAVGQLSDMEAGHEREPNITRYAFLVRADAYEKARQFAKEVGRYGQTVVIFNSMDAASVWLGMDVSKVNALIESIAD